MAQQTKGLFTRILEGSEQSADCARKAPPKSRYQLFKDIFSGSFWNLVKINLLMLLFFLPMLIVVGRGVLLSLSNGILYPFGANLGVGYPAMPNLQGASQMIAVESWIQTGGLIVLTSVVAAVGLAGGMYAIRNVIWTEGTFVFKDFWRGIKLNFVNALQAALFFTVVLLVTQMMSNLAEFNVALGAAGAELVWLRVSQVLSYILLGVSACMALWMIALGVNYKMNVLELFKNSFLMTFGTLLQTVFFGVVALIPFIALLLVSVSEIFLGVALGAVTLFAFSYMLLVWLNFAQWVFDQYVTPKAYAGKKAGKDKKEDKKADKAEGKSRLLSKSIKPIDDGKETYELPKAFTRKDLKKLKENKAEISADAEAYENEQQSEAQSAENAE
jgi:uncharacterized membrane protein YesL